MEPSRMISGLNGTSSLLAYNIFVPIPKGTFVLWRFPRSHLQYPRSSVHLLRLGGFFISLFCFQIIHICCNCCGTRVLHWGHVVSWHALWWHSKQVYFFLSNSLCSWRVSAFLMYMWSQQVLLIFYNSNSYVVPRKHCSFRPQYCWHPPFPRSDFHMSLCWYGSSYTYLQAPCISFDGFLLWDMRQIH